MKLLLPEGWERPKGFSHGVVAEGKVVFVAGQIGAPQGAQIQSDEFVDQFREALHNIVTVLAQAGAKPEHLTRMTWFITDKQAYLASLKEMGEAYKAVIGRNYPTMSVIVVSALLEDRAKVEIEATAVIPAAGNSDTK